jgi:molybdenum cofactor guanylyltransferase
MTRPPSSGNANPSSNRGRRMSAPVGGTVPGLAGVILCGGRSRRMGRDKALVEVGGRPLVAILAERLATVADPILVASGRPGRYAGPLGGLAAALAASPHPLLAAVAVDMPFASSEVVRLLASRCEGHDAAVPVTTGGREPLHAVYAATALPTARLALAEGPVALRAVLDRLRVRDVAQAEWRAADPEGRFAWNLNRPGDLAALTPRGRRRRRPLGSSGPQTEG